MRPAVAPVVLALCAAPACSGPDSSDRNPSTLWLAPDRMEIYVKLVDAEPPPF